MYNNRIRNFELPENLFSNLGEMKTKKMDTPIIHDKKEDTPLGEFPINHYNFTSDTKLTSYANRKEYRNRIDKMYEDIKVKPIDNEIDNILYFDNYVEKGIVIKPKASSLKQFWTEYRLISNEKNNPPKKMKTSTSKKDLDNFDELFEALSQRVSEINKYIDELKNMKMDIDIKNTQLEEDKEKLSEEKKQFLSYKKTEEHKIKEEKETLKINFERLQTIIDDLDKKLVSIDKSDN